MTHRAIISLVVDLWPMAEIEFNQRLESVRETFEAIVEVLNPRQLESDKDELEIQVTDPGLWDDQARAQKLTSKLSRAKQSLETISRIESRISDAEVLYQMSQDEQDSSAEAEAVKELQSLEKDIAELEVQTLLNGEYDERGAVMTIRSGAGGDDATDFAEMLLRMYSRFAEKRGWKPKVLDTSYAEGAGIKSATLEVGEPFAFGQLSVEAGTHRLVRMSPFNAAGKRQTSFAAVEVVPLIESTDEIEIDENDLKIDVYRSSGPGGQSVNTTDSAVRITHQPTGTVVSCQNEKSQLQNKAAAMRVLQSRLLEIKRREELATKKELAGDVKASWGEQMRSYVLAPYQMVKDLRTDYEVNNPDEIFDGDLDGFVQAGIRWRKRS